MAITLRELKEKMERIKSDISKKEGERSAVLAELKREFEFEDLDDAYKELDKLQAEINSKEKKQTELIADIQDKLRKYGY